MADLKQLMRGKAALQQKKITHPLAKYSATGALTCIVCSQAVKSEALWPAHLLSKSHKAQVQAAQAGAKRSAAASATSAAKRAPESSSVPTRAVASDPTKHSATTAATTTTAAPDSRTAASTVSKGPVSAHAAAAGTAASALPKGFFQSKGKEAANDTDEKAGQLPSGFFDTKVKEKMDAEAQKHQPKVKTPKPEQVDVEEENTAQTAEDLDVQRAMQRKALFELEEQQAMQSKLDSLKEKAPDTLSMSSVPLSAAEAKRQQAAKAESESDLSDFDDEDLLGWRKKGL
eukprot:m.45399 g.45399  ORF g.45399 m.45399 type:complete len:288 (+) comp14666_c0_seq1:1082-1945(+)